ncbi:Conserved protein of unknown function [Bradyrhizobium sp. ORS 285]|uniref:hypothetical protein n=1 Tax=Bradyrhizobium sp. ORS 285 TaxID=115808 RepID=UPI000B575CC6|nr:hypothetical protein [Bradyrhizobium sp. ORS 285]SMX55975.1 Conserved protein of unknown function [Bradyrhizobium sp. ORS 285]
MQSDLSGKPQAIAYGDRCFVLVSLRIVMAGPVPAIHVVRLAENHVDARAFAAPKRLRPRRRDKPGHDGVTNLRIVRRENLCI